MQVYIPDEYNPKLNIRQTEIAIKQIKDYFERALAENLNLTRVSAPLFVYPASGLNDNLNGIDRPVSFDVKEMAHTEVEVVQSLAKWKRVALKRYGFLPGEGLYTDMNAIRRDDEIDNTHSIYVDQWDWEKIIKKEDRTIDTLQETVLVIFDVFKKCQQYITSVYPTLSTVVPDELLFISSQELEDMYPDLAPKERENEICKTHKAVFVTQIGGVLKSGEKHDGRAPDYDDWTLNGDLLFWYPVLNRAIELTSMGIRVDESKLLEKIKLTSCEDRLNLEYHQSIINHDLPYTIGGGLGQSRICMFLLGKAHVGEVHSSVWPSNMVETCEKNRVMLL